MSTRAKTAVLYARVSTVRQAEEELPLESQIAHCKEKAAALEARVDRVFVDAGRSGRDESRPEFQAAIDYCEALSPDYFITWSTSRFSRDKIHAGLYKLRLSKAGTEIVYVSTPIDRQTDSGWMTEGMLELFDEFYSRQISADTTRSMVKNAMSGYFNGGTPPYGFCVAPAEDNPKRKKLVPNPDEAVVVNDIFKMRHKGAGAKSIAMALQSRGVTNRSRMWTKSSISALLRNEAVIGRIVFGRRDKTTKRIRPRSKWIVVDAHEPIIPTALFESVQGLMDGATAKSNKGSPKSTYMFTGILYCAETGSSMQIESAKGQYKRYWYYNCRDAQKKGVGRNRRIAAREFDEWLIGVILKRILSYENLAGVVRDIDAACGSWACEHKHRRQSIASELASVERRQQKIYELFEEYGKDTPNLGDLTKRLRANNERVKKLEANLTAIDAEQQPEINVSDKDVDELAANLRYIVETTKKDNPKKVREFLGQFVDRVLVSDSSVRIEYRPECLVVNNQELEIVPSKAVWLPEHTLLGTKKLVVQLPERFRRKAA